MRGNTIRDDRGKTSSLNSDIEIPYFVFELNTPIEFVAFIAYAVTTPTPLFFMLHRVAPTSLFVRQLMSHSPCKKEKEARERKGTNKASDRELREQTRIETSYRYESATGCQPARLRASRMFLFIPRPPPPLSLSSTFVAFSRPQYLFSSVTSVPASRFTSAISHLDTRRNVSGRWKRRQGRR